MSIEVDGKPIQARKGQMIIQATDAAGIYIPRFCYHAKLPVAANCRMCLVEVEKSPKPLPACATPVAEGMKVYTRSDRARDAQKGVMEFLLINHPLDCPICDQGGECPLQDQALGYGKDYSRYEESKRVVADKDIGPLIATFMTRCIHCTRCVRFGQELAGVMEFGMLGRGEHSEIRTFLDRSVDSELSGNVIDLCPVGALTSKPFQYTARPWELSNHASISPHDCVGANINVQTLRGKVMRVLPRVNEAVNECWLADRDRFAYEGLNSDERLRVPMVHRGGQWEEVDWATALEFTVNGLQKTIAAHGAGQLGALASPTSTLEEFYLLQKLVRALGSDHVDHRLRQLDFSDDRTMPRFPSLGVPFPALEDQEAVLLIGANPRKDQPLLGLRLRKAVRYRGAQVLAVNPVDYEYTYAPAARFVGGADDMYVAVGEVLKALAAELKAPLHEANWVDALDARPHARAIAAYLARPGRKLVLLGNYAMSHPQAAGLRALAARIAAIAGATLGMLPEANSAGAWLAGCVPHRGPNGAAAREGGLGVQAMLRSPRKAYLLLGIEPELDILDAPRAAAAMDGADFVAMLSAFKPSIYRSRAVGYADVLLPIAPFSETAGTFVNAEGRRQPFEAATRPLGEARPAWKILRVLGNHLGLPGFEYTSLDEVRAELDQTIEAGALQPGAVPTPARVALSEGELARIAEVPIYAVDPIVRRAASLQKTADNPPPAARVNAAEAARRKLADGDSVDVHMAEGEARLPLVIDARVPDGCVLIPSGYPETATLGPAGPVSLERAS
ncbi:NADH dehydrogenase subunit G [Sulfurifustis variabilis]|uniref:NADH-quinone oxidoreductase n=1 Tax=Sulfurifustis variabilis TaxID=1675686 RepID=A0A1B4VC98_9GAMM|nr:NADH dehydrogenase subunit G [Sulfurifustis variabilis]